MADTVTAKAAREALNNMRKLSPANEKYDDDLEMSIKETAFFMAPALILMSKRGFTSKELSEGLARQGISIKPGTLNRYLNEYLASKQGAKKSEKVSKNNDQKNIKADSLTKPSLSSLTTQPKDSQRLLDKVGKNEDQKPDRPMALPMNGKPQAGVELQNAPTESSAFGNQNKSEISGFKHTDENTTSHKPA